MTLSTVVPNTFKALLFLGGYDAFNVFLCPRVFLFVEKRVLARFFKFHFRTYGTTIQYFKQPIGAHSRLKTRLISLMLQNVVRGNFTEAREAGVGGGRGKCPPPTFVLW